MSTYHHNGNPLTETEWVALLQIVKKVANMSLTRRFIEATEPLGVGVQTIPTDTFVGITEGYKNLLGSGSSPVEPVNRNSGVVPIISKDFTLHWRDVEESRLMGHPFSMAKAAAAATCCARSEDKFVLYGHAPLGHTGIMTVEGRNIIGGLSWGQPGLAFDNFTRITRILLERGHHGPFAAVVHPNTYADMHKVLKGSSLLEIAHVRALLTAGVYRSSLLAPRSGVVISTGRQNLELVVSIDTSVAFLGARRMNLPFRVLKAVYLRIRKADAICTF